MCVESWRELLPKQDACCYTEAISTHRRMASGADASASGSAALGAMVQMASAEESALHLQVRLRAKADELVVREHREQEQSYEASLDCRAYLDLVTQVAEAAEAAQPAELALEAGAQRALQRLQQQSARYLRWLDKSTSRLAALGSDLLVTAVRATPGGEGVGDSCVLTHGSSRYVTALLLAMAKRTHFSVLIAEDQPDGSGHRTAAELLAAGVPVRMIEFGAVARCMAQVQLVLCGAHAVLADGGVLGQVGTLTLAHAAKALGRPLYVAVPHHAFCHARHLDATAQTAVRGVPAPSHPRILLERPRRDSTPPQLVTLLLTDIGVLTASAVADEMLMRQHGPVEHISAR